MNAQTRINHRFLVATHAAGADRMEAGGTDVTQEFEHVGISGDFRSGQVFGLDEVRQGRRVDDLANHMTAFDQHLAVAWLVQKIRPDRRWFERVGGLDHDGATAFRA